MNRPRIWWGIIALTVLSACGTNNITDETTSMPPPTVSATPTATATQAPTATPASQAATALFSVDPTDAANPFPSDRLLDSTGHVQVPASYLDPGLPPTPAFDVARSYVANVVSQLQALTGFGTFTPIRVPFDRPVVVDVGENPRGLWLLQYDDLAAAPARIAASFYYPDTSIEVQPVLPLKPKTTYALVITTDLTDAGGNHVRPSSTFAQVLSGTGLSPELSAYRTRLDPVIDFLGTAFGFQADSLALIDLFTTEPITDDLVAIQRRLVSGEIAPTLPVFQNSPIHSLETGIFPEGTPQFQDVVGAPTSDNVAAIAVGSFDSHDFRTRANGPFAPRFVNGPDIPPVNHLDFYMTIPKAARPANGYPIAIFGHGLGGSDRDVVYVPHTIGDAPIMGIAISALQHGRRGMPTNFLVLNDVSATREFIRQTIADFLQLERMVRNAKQAGIAPFDQVDTDHILYFGGSLGGIMGTVYMAVEPDVAAGMLSVPGGGLLNVLESHDIGQLVTGLVELTTNIAKDSPFFPLFLHRFQQFGQWVLDPADPINYAPYLLGAGPHLPGVPAKRILVHEGIIDNTVPNRTTDDLALAMRLPDLNITRGCLPVSTGVPNETWRPGEYHQITVVWENGQALLYVDGNLVSQQGDGCSGIWRYVMTDYGQPELSGHAVTTDVPQARNQAAEFLSSFGTVVPDASPDTQRGLRPQPISDFGLRNAEPAIRNPQSEILATMRRLLELVAQ
jgi:hypothetical protein